MMDENHEPCPYCRTRSSKFLWIDEWVWLKWDPEKQSYTDPK